MNSDQLVSIIIPCYRQAEFLPSSIDSALRQSHPQIELVVVNDGSDDNTDDVAHRYRDRIQYVYKANGGQGSARNAGMRKANGRYLLFLDADDALHSDAVSWLMKAINGSPNSMAAMGYVSFEGTPSHAITENLPASTADLVRWLMGSSFGMPASLLIPHAAVLAVGGFDESRALQGCEDWDLWCRLALHGLKVSVVPRVGAYYRCHPLSMTRNTRQMLIARSEVLLRLHEQFLNNEKLLAVNGSELLETEHRVLRRVRAQLAPHPLEGRLTTAICQLKARGIPRAASRTRSWAEAVLGYDLTERMAFGMLRLVDRASIRRYAEGYT